MLGGNELLEEIDEFDYDHEMEAGDASDSDEGPNFSASPTKSKMINLDGNSGQKLDSKGSKRNAPIAYPKTCGFSWNCYGQMVFFSNGKYDLAALEKDKSKKKFTDWDASHYNSFLVNKQENSNFRKYH